MATGSIFAIVFGILLALSLIAIGYLFFSHRRDRPSKNMKSETAIPFQNVEYEYLGPTSQAFLDPTPQTLMQSSDLAVRTADTKINSEVVGVNVSHPLISKVLQRLLTISIFSPLV